MYTFYCYFYIIITEFCYKWKRCLRIIFQIIKVFRIDFNRIIPLSILIFGLRLNIVETCYLILKNTKNKGKIKI